MRSKEIVGRTTGASRNSSNPERDVFDLFDVDKRYSAAPYAQQSSAGQVAPHNRRKATMKFWLQVLVVRYVMPIDEFSCTKTVKAVAKIVAVNPKSKPPITLLKLVQVVKPLESLLPAVTRPMTEKPSSPEVSNGKRSTKRKKTKASPDAPSTLDGNKIKLPRKER